MAVKQYSFTVYYIGLLLLAAGIPLWMLLMSMSQILILISWLIDGNIKEKFIRAFTNPVVLVLTGLFFLHIAGLLYTTDFDYAKNDLRIKLPMLLLPVVIATMPSLSPIQFNNVLKVLILATFASTLCSMAVFFGIIPKHVENIRDISLFISHIRLSLIICVAVVAMIYLLYESDGQKMALIYIPLIVWFIAFLVILESLTGIAILSVLMLMACFYLAWKSKSKLIRVLTFVCLVFTFIAGFQLYRYLFIDSIVKVKVDQNALKKYTSSGNPYTHYLDKQDTENGNPVWINICETELDSAWSTRSKLNYFGKDLRHQDLKYTLIRYLASKNYQGDAVGVSQLSLTDIAAIENGIANYRYLSKSNFRARLQQLAWEYRNYYYSGNPSGHSAMQRIEFWKTAIYIISEHPVIGVGTGDVKAAFDQAYIDRKSQLTPKFRFHAHNEYLTMTVAFGILGGMYFIFSLVFPYIYMRKKKDLLYTAFFIILLISMLTEDTPETQAGVTFMVFFNTFFLFHNNKKPQVS